MTKQILNKPTNLVYTSNCNINVKRRRISFFLIIIFLVILFIINTDITLIFIGYIVTFFVIFHTLLKLSSIFKPWSRTYIEPDHNYKPFVSIHVACKNEPAETVIKTIEALAELSYINYEVIVINNNNLDKKNWSKIQKYVKSCGDNFKFIHLDKITGFKSGALNYLNDNVINKKTEIEAIVDCDYIVSPDFLNKTVGYFKNPKIGIVQAPQDYYNVNQFNIGLFCEYRSFFELVMHQAQRLGLVTFTGTMGLIRADLLKNGLRWNEWCITEDVEAGTHINSLGYKGVYVDKSLGKGLMPFDYLSMVKQRQRWTYGNMQIISKDFFYVVANKSLTFKQKIAFLTQLATWFHFELVISIVYLGLNIMEFFGYTSNGVMLVNNLMLILLAFSICGNFIYFLVGMRKHSPVLNRIKAFFTHYGLLYVMSASWVSCLLGQKLGFIVTKKKKNHKGIPFKQYSKEFIIIILLLLSLFIKTLNGKEIFLDLIIILSLLIIEFSGIMYLRRAFIKSS